MSAAAARLQSDPATIGVDPATIGVDELAGLYERDGARLLRVVRLGVQAPEPLIEDACQIAWSRLIDRRDRVARDTVTSWLVVTAVREACRLARRAAREVSLEALRDQLGELAGASAGPSAADVFNSRARLDALRTLPARQRRLVWLQGLGLSYAEIALSTGDTVRTVERQLGRARRRLSEAAERDGAAG